LPDGGALGHTVVVDRLRLADLALAVGLMGFGAIWSWLGVRRLTGSPPRGSRLAAVLCLLLAAGGPVAAVILEGRAARPW
jgi:hypothetical protein